MSAPASGFDGPVEDFEFTVGSVTGYRGFKQDGLGRLTGVTHSDRVFRPGVNVAECDYCSTRRLSECGCGFYAYFDEEVMDESSAYLLPTKVYGGTVGALVRGHGRVVLGTKGFRAEKAELLALFPLEPRKHRALTANLSPFRFLYPTASTFRRVVNVFTVILSLLLSVATFVTGMTLVAVSFDAGQDAAGWLYAAGLFAAVTWLAGLERRLFTADLIGARAGDSDDPDVRRLNRLCRPGKTPVGGTGKRLVKDESVDPFIRLARLYPEARVFDSLYTAIKEFPLTSTSDFIEPEPEPETDPDFWDRDASTGRVRGRLATSADNLFSASPGGGSQSLKDIQARVDKLIADRYSP